jgi:hypothetical protein
MGNFDDLIHVYANWYDNRQIWEKWIELRRHG